MPYYIRVLAEKAERIHLQRLTKRLRKERLNVTLVVEAGAEEAWDSLLLAHLDGGEIAVIERNPVESSGLGKEELEEFVAEVTDARPRSAANWLKAYLPTIKSIYAFQLLSGTDRDRGFEAVWAIQGELWQRLGGIFQSDGEGFSNREGYQITWDFSDTAIGPWKMAVLERGGVWKAFEMELSDPDQRNAFLEGRIPPRVRLL
jgi:hypothetical protein